MTPGSSRGSMRRGFTLMEVIFAVGIAATALIALQATITGSILSASDSINRRAARGLARGKMEEVLAGSTEPEGSGSFEDYPHFQWSSRTDELSVGGTGTGGEGEGGGGEGGEGGGGGQSVRVVTLTLTYPVEAGGEGDQPGSENVVFSSVLPAESEDPAAPPPGG